MSKIYAKIENDWCNLCSGRGKLKLADGTWKELKPLTDDIKYYNGEEWKDLDCCYSIDVDIPESLPAPLESKLNLYPGGDSPFSLGGINFMDEIKMIPTCEELKNICCADSDENSLTNFRIYRDNFLQDLNENVLNSYVGKNEANILDYSGYQQGGLGDRTIFFKGGLLKLNTVTGCAECTYDYFETATNGAMLSVTDSLEYLPFVYNYLDPLPEGGPGKLVGKVINIGGDVLWYAWNELTDSWDNNLYDSLEDILSFNHSKRDAWLKALNQNILALQPFLYANDYLPNHRWKIEEI